MKDLKYSEIIKLNKGLSGSGGTNVKIALLSNVMVHYWKEVLEYALRLKGFEPSLYMGDYDNILQESSNIADHDVVCIIWELSNLLDGLEYKAELLTHEELDSLKNKVRAEVQLTLENLKDHSLVLLSKFSAQPFRSRNLRNDAYSQLANELNEYLIQLLPNNTTLVDLDPVYQQVGIDMSINTRDYYTSKTLYTTDFFKSYTAQLIPFFTSAYGKAKKALIFDCDNTLWKGVLGEDGFDGIKMSAKSPMGVPYEAVQYMAKELSRKGIIIGLCSKNNAEDVEQVINTHPDFALTQEEIVIKKVNWTNKASNINEIAKELNIGLDSIVFVDDSDFEVNLIREELPEVEVIQVPKRAHSYPGLIREKMQLFFSISETKEDKKKALMYKQQAVREQEKNSFTDIKDFLKSLELEIDLSTDKLSILPRVSQMTQKTNQFNFTTKRYTEQDIQAFYDNPDYTVVALNSRDKFGDSGITGLIVLRREKTDAHIDTFLMSCRILGRTIENKFLDTVISILAKEGVKTVKGIYIPTKKNTQVSELYDKFGFSLLNESTEFKEYTLDIESHTEKKLDYIKVKVNGRES